jgi:hypothetical protein
MIAALEEGRTSWTRLLDARRLLPGDDEAAVTAAQVRDVVGRVIDAGQWQPGDPDILLVFDAGYDLARLAYLLGDLPVQVLGRLRSDRVMGRMPPPRFPGTAGRPSRHGDAFDSKIPQPGVPRCRHGHRHHPVGQGRSAGLQPGCIPG